VEDKCILVVEDEATAQMLLKKIMEKEGLNAQVCSNGAEALYYFLRDPDRYPVIVLDLMMPEVSGETFLAVIESLHDRNLLNVDSRVIIDTAAHEFAYLKDLAEYNSVHAICKKPIEKAKLLNYIAQIWNPKQGMNETTDLDVLQNEPVGAA
jgi:CheY-like chemotaxis protein